MAELLVFSGESDGTVMPVEPNYKQPKNGICPCINRDDENEQQCHLRYPKEVADVY